MELSLRIKMTKSTKVLIIKRINEILLSGVSIL